MTVIRWISGLAAIAALAWFLSSMTDVDAPRRSPVSAEIDPPVEDLPATVRPSATENASLSAAELRWCMTEGVRLEAMEPHLATRPGIDRYNRLADDFNRRCGGRGNPDEEARNGVVSDIAASRDSIVAAALEEIRQVNETVPLTAIRAQELLSTLGYDPGVSDGAYGAKTRAAIEAFQRDKGLQVDGLLSARLLDEMALALTRGRTGRRERVVVAVSVTQANTRRPVVGAEVAISNDRGFQRTADTNARGRAEFVSVPAGSLDVHVQRNGSAFAFQATVTEDPRQEVVVEVP